jgi:hypothetical protein
MNEKALVIDERANMIVKMTEIVERMTMIAKERGIAERAAMLLSMREIGEGTTMIVREREIGEKMNTIMEVVIVPKEANMIDGEEVATVPKIGEAIVETALVEEAGVMTMIAQGKETKIDYTVGKVERGMKLHQI